MIDVLRFWRDVEIFNIPDAPTPKNPAQPGSLPPTDDAESDLFPDSDNVPANAADGCDSEAPTRPRSHVVQRFPTRADRVKDRKAAFPPLLPWHDPRFQIPDESEGPLCEPEVPESESRDDGPRPPDSYAHAIYLGVGPKQRFVEFILHTHALAPTAEEIHRPATGEGWLAAFLVDEDGVPLPNSYVAASFAVGSGVLLENRSLDAVGAELQERTVAFDNRMDERRQNLEHDRPRVSPFGLTWEDLIDEWEHVHLPLGGTDDADDKGPLGPFIVIQSVPLYRRKDGSLNPPPEQAATFLNSFFIDDLTTLIQDGPTHFSAALKQYLGADSPTAERLDLLADPQALVDHVSPAFLPSGRWIAKPNEHLALAQQAAVYQILHRIGRADGDCSRGLMAVNGPPGTGKTTLLKDVIAEVVVQRAKRLSALKDPQELFTDQIVRVSGGDDKRPDAPALRTDVVAGTEIVVTSSNNTAVQNISFELPFSRDASAFPNASYLPEVAALVAEKFRLQRKNPWGLVSGALGAKPNRDKIATALMGFEKAVDLGNPETHPQPDRPSSLKPWLDLARRRGKENKGGTGRQRWNEAKADFQKRLDDVEAKRAELTALNAAMRELPQLPVQRERLQTQLDEQRRVKHSSQIAETARQADWTAAHAQDQTALQALANRRAALDSQRSALVDKLKEVRDLNEPGWLARGLKKILGVETKGYKAWKDEVKRARAAVEAVEAELKATEDERNRIAQPMSTRAEHADQASRAYEARVRTVNSRMTELDDALKDLNARESELQERVQTLRASADVSDDNLPNDAFFSLEPGQQHLRSLWVSEPLDRARAELFLAALRLHEATLMATADSWFKVLRVVRDVLNGQAKPVTNDDRAIIWHSLFFVVPVVSTTLASFGRLFQNMGRESLGWVLVDEAGQATTASVAGALWRARRAVIVGDPLQIEPVVTAPRQLVERLGGNNGMDYPAIIRWSPAVQSAQTLSDRTMRLGAMVGDVWTGLPLRTHRRCMRPMFEIANRIAYDDQMVQATQSKVVLPDLFKSCWIDVRGKALDKVVDEEIRALTRILESFLLEWPQVVNSQGEKAPASVYVISPFRDVALACKERIGSDSPLGRRFAKRKLVVDAGTVHTFQGKEASIVFLVLGSASGNAGAGSRRWAASKPNLLNVAVTRAQQRFYVIGNYADWTGLPFFSEMAEKAEHMRRTRIESISGTRQVRLVLAPTSEAMAE
ncbi:hypothetical protein DFQ28_004392 [Apophysomyces sp. BC1034]|nr:hypothetical protein DFQ28_004392 [Apophysomyces sp. BC1034]